MKALFKGLALLAFAGFVSSSAVAAERATAEEATALVKKAVAYIKANGKEKAFAAINDPKGQFVDRDLYIFVYDMKGTNMAIGNGNASKMNGKNLMDLRDADGKYIIKGFIDLLGTKNGGWFDYKWPNPVTKAVEAKSSYVEKVDDLIVGAGIYKQ
ncbi:cache domain-containing protein [Noviherbaspirillum denitrificans]|uniref:Histidine kinase n=1 Tax=Noviherbaspirillum denitrificans TaxID=1968433 RepID=A0A254TLX7_9BURK|nr:cache domain-containing protein [Noviherbaspirillum denitrificans]OWW20708.1 histidine kinase [Noviherbaspirillum denitrificans]